MAMELETRRLVLRPWTEGDAEDYRALVAERDTGAVTVETVGERIARQLASAERTGIALLTVRRRRAEADFVGECKCTRALTGFWVGCPPGRRTCAPL
jgi:hypothetical protein